MKHVLNCDLAGPGDTIKKLLRDEERRSRLRDENLGAFAMTSAPSR
jgi:hypothetical protein